MTSARPDRRARGGAAWREGHAAEWLAAAWLMATGHRILAFRLKTPQGEIDLLAHKGRELIVVEVKRRARRDAAELALTPQQARRLLAAGEAVRRSRPALRALTLRIDLIALGPGRLPRHLKRLAFEG
ncbi:MAG: YraN family protein [Alphaproteobacteria bacterium]|nr:YraN family protein [Alphaproteobacteria bacterium]MBU2118024.1 YraN family protein [Alphaproteobacteria bacterium]MBU2352462.1 YraN family protein [Alphaproteobacteria bacterium]MBU2381681.1 YraN family protein [Alphaproteobacteria bacterium]